MEDIKTEVAIQLRDESGGYLSTAQMVSGIQVARACFRLWYRTWEPVVSIVLAGTQRISCQRKGGPQEAKTPRGGVPMRGTGADRPVRAVKPGNSGRAKGTDNLGLHSGQPLLGGMSR